MEDSGFTAFNLFADGYLVIRFDDAVRFPEPTTLVTGKVGKVFFEATDVRIV